MTGQSSFSSRVKRLRVPLVLGLGAALGGGALLSPPIYRTAATLGVDDAVGRFRSDVVRSAADLALSRPVLVRAATSLIDTRAIASQQNLLDRLGVLTAATTPADRATALADQLHGMIHAAPGPGGVTLDVTADAPDAALAARAATAVANALIALRDDSIGEMRRTRDAAASSRIAGLRTVALAAHHRLSTLAGTDTESAQGRVAAIGLSAAAQTRVAAIRAIIASGTPPLGTGKDMPQSVDALQTAYLDLTRKLAVASETLGDRHTTIIALREGVRRAGAALTDEWKRLLRIAEADLASTRQREAAYGKVDVANDASRQAAVEEARQAARMADDAVSRAEAQREAAAEDPAYHLVAPAPVPLAATAGYSTLTRVLMALAAGAFAAWLARLVASRGRKAPEVAPAMATSARIEPMPARATSPVHEAEPTRSVSDKPDLLPDYFAAEPTVAPRPAEIVGDRRAALDPATEDAFDPAVLDALGDIVDELVMADPMNGAVPTIMVAANEIVSDTSAVALTLADLAVERGMRVLLVEGPRQTPELAAAAEPDCEPALLDLFGHLRIVLQAEHAETLSIAPFFRNGASIATALSRNTQAPVLDDIGAEFDIIVVDGCRAADAFAAGLAADAYLRVGRFASRRDTDRFLTALDVDSDQFVGTVGTASLILHESYGEVWRASRHAKPASSAQWTVKPASSRSAASGSATGGPHVHPHRAVAQRATVATRSAYPRRAAGR